MPIDGVAAEGRVRAHTKADGAREKAFLTALPQAVRIAKGAAWIHRTGKPGGRDWRQIFEQRAITPTCAGSSCELNLGYEEASYWFFGHASYPKGNIAILVSLPMGASSTLTPFDSGGCACGRFDCSGSSMGNETDRCAFITGHIVQVDDALTDFLTSYLASLFTDPSEYVVRAEGQPQFPPYHGLTSKEGSRLAWTVERQEHQPVALEPDDSSVRSLVVNGRDLWLDLPGPYRRKAAIAAPHALDPLAFTEAISKHVQSTLAAP